MTRALILCLTLTACGSEPVTLGEMISAGSGTSTTGTTK